jgi:oxygen-independent coproporphyrinogen III oxidase
VIPRHLYVHVPFCVRRCSYCDFAVTALRDPPVAAWLDAVARELALHAAAEGWPTSAISAHTSGAQQAQVTRRDDGSHGLKTLYVGGGTPSLLGAGALSGLARQVQQWFGSVPRAAEWTAEANPESFTAPLAEDWLEAGVNRVSLGTQSFDAGVLRWMGRLHGAAGPAAAMAAARAAGFENVSIDLIFGLPERLHRDWAGDLGRALDLEPDHISLYGLTAEAATPLGRWVAEGRERLADEERYRDEYLLAAETLRAAGFVHYEVSNFARPGRESRHNRAYWDGSPYLGIGPGAHSYLPPRRFWNLRDWSAYRERLSAGVSAVEGVERVDAAAAGLEGIWLGLRTDRGLAALTAAQRAIVERWRGAGWAEVEEGRVRLTAEGWLLLDRLAVELEATAA